MRTVFLHGFATTPEVWHNQQPDLAPQLRFDDIAGEASRVIKELWNWGTGDIVLVGWSLGGMVALRAAAIAPEKIKTLILVSTTPKYIRSDDFPFGTPLVLLKRLEKRIAREGTKAFHDLVFKNGARIGVAHLTINEVERELRMLERIDLRPLLAKIACPTLIIHGDRDEICPPAAAIFMKENIPGSELVMLEGVGHAPMIEAPELFNSHMQRFIDNHAG